MKGDASDPIERSMNKLCPMPGCRVKQITREDPGLLSITAQGTRPGGAVLHGSGTRAH